MDLAEHSIDYATPGLDLYHGLKPPPVFWPLILSVQPGRTHEREDRQTG